MKYHYCKTNPKSVVRAAIAKLKNRGITTKATDKSQLEKGTLIENWNATFPGQTVPRLVYVLEVGYSDDQVSGEEYENTVSFINLISDVEEDIDKWYSLLINKNTEFYKEMLLRGSDITKYREIREGTEESRVDKSEELGDRVEEMALELTVLENDVRSLPDSIAVKHLPKTRVKRMFTVKELKDICKANKLKKYSKLKEDDLIDFMKEKL